MQMRILNAAEIRQALLMKTVVEAMKEAYGQLSAGQASVPLRSRLQVGENRGVALIMPALLHQSGDMSVKIVSVFPKNSERGLPSIHAIVAVIDPETGQPVALLEGGTLTAIRTGAGSGAATDLLSRPESSSLAIFGSGVQARTQVEAVCSVREIEQIWIFGIDPLSVEDFHEELTQKYSMSMRISVANSPAEAIHEADIICTATTSSTPVFPGAELRPGTHINAVGSFTPEMQEIDAETMKKAMVVVDSRQAALEETGDLIIPIGSGELSEADIHAEIGEIVLGNQRGRSAADQITLFKSVGVAVQDAAAASLAVKRAEEMKLGQLIDL